jgi:predicted transcriptional regulator of viral defense system
MKLEKAFLEYLHTDQSQSGWTQLDLQLLIEALYKIKEWKGEPLNIHSDRPPHQTATRLLKKLLYENRLESHVKNGKLYTLPFTDLTDPEIASISAPQAYITYLEAMRHYGITDRLPKNIELVQPSDEHTIKQLLTAHYRARYKRLADITGFMESYPGQFKVMRPKGVSCNISKSRKLETRIYRSAQMPRYVSIGRLFIDMVQKPDLCSGMDHVINVYLEYAPQNKPKIIRALSEGEFSKITKVKVGFLLAELCGIRSSEVMELQEFKQRGGSAKLISNEPYDAKYIAEDWELALNMERPEFDRFRY